MFQIYVWGNHRIILLFKDLYILVAWDTWIHPKRFLLIMYFMNMRESARSQIPTNRLCIKLLCLCDRWKWHFSVKLYCISHFYFLFINYLYSFLFYFFCWVDGFAIWLCELLVTLVEMYFPSPLFVFSLCSW